MQLQGLAGRGPLAEDAAPVTLFWPLSGPLGPLAARLAALDFLPVDPEAEDGAARLWVWELFDDGEDEAAAQLRSLFPEGFLGLLQIDEAGLRATLRNGALALRLAALLDPRPEGLGAPQAAEPDDATLDLLDKLVAGAMLAEDPAAVQAMMDAAMLEMLDRPQPEFGDRSLRELAASDEDAPQVVAWLVEAEYAAAQDPTFADYDFTALWLELGLVRPLNG